MSYEAWGEPDDDDMGERAAEAGYIDPETAEELRDILSVVDIANPTPGDRAMAALILINNKLNPKPPHMPEAGVSYFPDPHILWARTLLDLVR